ncbi:MAG: META domain-containing protein, partial [Anaerolineales bacterium]|nr:META domain-containing protein [Anaerolineales bacterium]
MSVTLTAAPWQWTNYAGADDTVTIETPDDYVVTFNTDGALAVTAGCQRVTGTYKVSDDG